MDTETAAPESIVPVKIQQSQDDAPPTLAEPVSGPVAAMSGALGSADANEVPAVVPANAETHAANGAVEPHSKIPLPSTAAVTVNHPVEVAPSIPAAPEGTDIKDTTEPTSAPTADETAPETNGTPAKKGSIGKRKSIGGVPEHKNKKLNKKKSIAKITHLDAKPGEFYFARLKSYAPWPSIMCDEEMLPQILLNTRPVTTMKKDGTYNEAYEDGGKKVADRTYPIMFLATNEFAWIPNTDLTPLKPEDCKDVAEKGKSKSLIAAYHVAEEGHDLQYFKDMLLDHAKAMEEDDARRQARIAEKAAARAEKAAAKPEKKKRKSEAKVATDDVEMEDADDDADVKKSSKKRKKEAESDDDETEKPAKTPKTTKLKLTTNKTPTTTEKKPKEKAVKPKAEKKKAKAATTSDDEMPDVAEEEEEQQPLDPVEARKAREKEVLFLRHKLQKGFLSRDQAPQEEEMPQMSNFIKKLENYGELEVSIIRNTKINKVLKALVKLNSIPKDEEFNFRKRSVDLLAKWNKILGAEPTDGEGTGSAEKDSKSTPTTNGVHDEKTEDKKEDGDTPVEKPAEGAEHIEKPSVEAAGSAKPDVPEQAQEEPKQSTVDDAAPAAEPPKVDAPLPVIEKVPESAEAAAEATNLVKATE